MCPAGERNSRRERFCGSAWVTRSSGENGSIFWRPAPGRQTAPRLKLVGVSALGEDGKDADGVVNEINGEEPDFVLSLLGMPLAMDFLEKEQERINAGFWCGLGREYLSERRWGLRARLKGHLDKNKLARSRSRYDEGEHAYRAKERD